MRGKPPTLGPARWPTRIIPAHAGQTIWRHEERVRPPDHPRACGANVHDIAEQPATRGSSPRMRGKRGDPRAHRPAERIIPAHAGQTSTARTSSSTRTDHPRACGANRFRTLRKSVTIGSSPRMRGKHIDGGHKREHVRIIPAHAGQTGAQGGGHVRGADHPRACGANWRCTHWRRVPAGSSPRMRGKHDAHADSSGDIRIIPAHAGQTRTVGAGARIWADHPRACGANWLTVDEKSYRNGSSPRMRGKLCAACAMA